MTCQRKDHLIGLSVTDRLNAAVALRSIDCIMYELSPDMTFKQMTIYLRNGMDITLTDITEAMRFLSVMYDAAKELRIGMTYSEDHQGPLT